MGTSCAVRTCLLGIARKRGASSSTRPFVSRYRSAAEILATYKYIQQMLCSDHEQPVVTQTRLEPMFVISARALQKICLTCPLARVEGTVEFKHSGMRNSPRTNRQRNHNSTVCHHACIGWCGSDALDVSLPYILTQGGKKTQERNWIGNPAGQAYSVTR